MARFLFTVWPFAGCVHPFIAVANKLGPIGHEVAFYSGERARDVIESQGFAFFPFDRLDERAVDALVCSPAGVGANWSKPWRLGGMLRALFLETTPAQIDDLRAIRASWRYDAIVCDPAMWGPFLILHESDSIPVALCSYAGGCMLPGPGAPPVGLGLPLPRGPLGRFRNAVTDWVVRQVLSSARSGASSLRLRYGLPPLDGPVIGCAANLPLYLLPSCPEYDYNRKDLPESVKYVGPLQWYPETSRADKAPLPEDGHPLVHVTEGTLHYQKPFVLKAAVAGLANLHCRVLLTTGDRAPADLGLPPLSPNTTIRRWLPHDKLLPKCDVMVTTAGGGTVMAGLEHGVPMVLVPTEWDKAENAQRVVEAGAGIRLAPSRCTPSRLRKAVETVLNDPSYTRNAQRLARGLSRYGGPAEAAGHLDAMLAGDKEKIGRGPAATAFSRG